MRSSFLASLSAASLVALLGVQAVAAQPPKVVTSILPLQSLAANVMRGIGTPELLVEGAATPHSFQLRPSDAAALQEADLVVWVGEGLESFLEAPLASLAGKARVLELGETQGVSLLPNRDTSIWHAEGDHEHAEEHQDEEHNEAEHDDGEEHHEDHEQGHGHDHGDYDPHVWLDAGNAIAAVEAIAEALSRIDPANAETYRANAENTVDRLAAMNAELTRRLEPLIGRPYVVFHDAYRYFEASYGLTPIGAVTLSPERSPGAQHLAEIRKELVETGAVCVFSEPQFEPKLLDVVTEGTQVRGGTLDPLGAQLEPGPEAYFTLMDNMAASLEDCLGKKG